MHRGSIMPKVKPWEASPVIVAWGHSKKDGRLYRLHICYNHRLGKKMCPGSMSLHYVN